MRPVYLVVGGPATVRAGSEARRRASPIAAGPGGSLTFTTSAQAKACATSADRTVDGTAYVHLGGSPIVEIVSIHLVVSGTESGHFDVDYQLKNGVTTYAIDVADGRVLVSIKGSWDDSTQSGTFVVVDKNDTWTCNLTNGKGQCTGTSGATRTIGN